MLDNQIEWIKNLFGGIIEGLTNLEWASNLITAIMEAIGILVSDIPRFLVIFLFGGIILGYFAAGNLAPTVSGVINNPDLAYCGKAAILKQPIILIPIFTYLTNPPLGQAEMACVFISQDYTLIGIYYAEIMVILFVAAIAGIIFLNLTG